MTLDYPPRPNRARTGATLAALYAVLRGLWAVARLLAGAVAALASAAIGTPPASATRLGHLIADEYRAGRAGAIDAEVIEDTADPDTESHAEPVKEGRQ
jgi:hypothetical protein